MSICLDSSVWVKLWLNEPHSAHARTLIQQLKQQRQSIWAPIHTRLEIADVFYQRWRRNQITEEECASLVSQVKQLPLRVDDDPDRQEEASKLAVDWNLPSIHDALYCSVSKHHGATLWTADETFHHRASRHVDWINLLSNYDMESE